MSVRRAIVMASLGRYSTRFMGLASTVIIARLLTPSEIGTYAIASAMVVLLGEFRLLGAGNYLIRERELNITTIRSALGLTILVSWGLGLLIIGASSYIASFYAIADLQWIFTILAFAFFLTPFLSIGVSLLSREMHFTSILWIQVISTAISIVVTLLLIFVFGLSYFSLAFGQLALTTSALAVMYYKRPALMVWRPGFTKLFQISAFGVQNSLANFLQKAPNTLPDMIIGKMGTTTQVGIFSRGFGFIDFVSQTLLMGIKPVALPYLSDVSRSGGDANQAYIKASVLLGGIIWPVLAVASVVSLPAIRLFFGAQWDESAPFATLLAYWTMLRAVHWLSSDFLLAQGKERILMIKEAILAVCYFISIVVAFPYGMRFVAMSFVVVGAIDLLLTSAFLSWILGLSMKKFSKSWLTTIFLTGISWISAYALYNWGDSMEIGAGDTMGAFILVATLSPPIWLASVILLKHPLRSEIIQSFKWILSKVK